MKPAKLSHADKAAARLAHIIGLGEVVTVQDAHGATYTVGRWTPAVGPRDRYAIFGYGRAAVPATEGLTAAEAAGAIVSRVGAGRARDAALAADKCAGRPHGRVVAMPSGTRRQQVTAAVVYG